MSQYRVINQKVEINGTTREIGAVLDENEFRAADNVEVFILDEKPEEMDEDQYRQLATEESLTVGHMGAPLSELDSLLSTGMHIELVTE